MNFTELSAALSEMGLPSYRAKQIYSWIHQKCALDYDEMTNLPLSLREKLKEELPLKKCTIERKQVSAEDGTVKALTPRQVADLLGHTTSEITELYYVKRNTDMLMGVTNGFEL